MIALSTTENTNIFPVSEGVNMQNIVSVVKYFNALCRVVATLLCLWLMVGCIKEDKSACREFRLYFKYAYNMESVGPVDSRMNNLRVYVFDKDNLLVQILHIGASDLARGYTEVDMDSGTYSFVAWGGSGDDLLSDGFMEVEMVDPRTHTYTPLRMGVTPLRSFCMMINHSTLLPREVLGDFVATSSSFGELFHANVDSVEIVRGADQKADFNFVKNTKFLKVTINGSENALNPELVGGLLPKNAPLNDPSKGHSFAQTAALSGAALIDAEQLLQVFVLGKNGRYRYDNQIEEYARIMRYESPCRYLPNSEILADIKTLRLSIDQQQTDSMTLYVRDAKTGQDLVAPLNVIQTILKVKDKKGNYVVTTQDDLDKYDEFPIDISIRADLSVEISIWGYVIQNSEHGIQ